MKVAVVGYGSIGSRHARILREQGCDVSIVSRHMSDLGQAYPGLEELMKRNTPDCVVIASATNRHYDELIGLARAGYRGTVLVEKPLFEQIRPVPDHTFSGLYVLYNLRFHPLIRNLREKLREERVLSAHLYVGQYLPSWRPDTDYRLSYSASASQGGGVLRDLSHELDYLGWMFGRWKSVSALGGKLSGLEIDSEDVFGLLASHERCPVVTIELNYLDRVGRRQVLVNTDQHTFEVDLKNGVLKIDGAVYCEKVERDESYIQQFQSLLNGVMDDFCNIADAQDVLALIEAAETSAREGKSVRR